MKRVRQVGFRPERRDVQARLVAMPAVPEVLRVALPVPLPTLFDYLPPAGTRPSADWAGRRVRVPFGRGDRVGVVLEVGEPGTAPEALRQAQALLDDELLLTLAFCARYYHAPPGEVLATALPGLLREGQPLPETTAAGWRITQAGLDALTRAGRGRPRALLERLRAAPATEDDLDAGFEGWREAARALARRGEAARQLLPPRTTLAE